MRPKQFVSPIVQKQLWSVQQSRTIRQKAIPYYRFLSTRIWRERVIQ